MTHYLCWRQGEDTHRARMSRPAADRFRRFLVAVFPSFKVWVEGDDA